MKYLIVLILAFGGSLVAVESSSLYYIKLGGIHPPGNTVDLLPTASLGARFERGGYGCDLSLNFGSCIFENYTSLKGIFLFYPRPQKRDRFYLGMGPGVGFRSSSAPMGGPYGATHSEWRWITLEGVLGYELRFPYLKTFIQLEGTQPALCLDGKHYEPALALTLGLGF
jgi:hypothetical protein